MSGEPRFLIVDGYPKAGRDELEAGGASRAGDLYARMLRRFVPNAASDILFPADPDAELPQGAGLEHYDGVAWTGSNLTIYDADPRVRRQIDLGREIFRRGIPSFGSCWAVQMAVVAAGGVVSANPRGREMGIARKIALTPEGRAHPMYTGKPSVFDAFISHIDEVTHLPAGGLLLASNPFTRVQAVSVAHGRGSFWALQYHPEYDLHEMARLIFCRLEKLIELGFFRDRARGLDYIDKLETLHREPDRFDLAWALGIDADVMREEVRQVEVGNWIALQVLPAMRR
ncbi:MAG: type 1 glutamine amidotransferase [Alphaproteobacteria bacterium]